MSSYGGEYPQWMDSALCSQLDVGDIFFPDKGGPVTPAKAICRMCPVAAECLTWALDNDIREGVFGGLSATERMKLARFRTCRQCRRRFPLNGTHAYCTPACRAKAKLLQERAKNHPRAA